MTTSAKTLIEIQGVSREGTSKSGNKYFIHTCYVTLPGVPYPQAIEVFHDSKVPSGRYQTNLCFSVEAKKIACVVDMANLEQAPVARSQAA